MRSFVGMLLFAVRFIINRHRCKNMKFISLRIRGVPASYSELQRRETGQGGTDGQSGNACLVWLV